MKNQYEGENIQREKSTEREKEEAEQLFSSFPSFSFSFFFSFFIVTALAKKQRYSLNVKMH